MRKYVLVVGVVAVAAFWVATAVAKNKVDVSKLPPPAERQVSFAKDIKPLFEASCAQCHGERRPKARYRMDNREDLLKGGNSGEAAVIPGKSAESPLVHHVADLVPELEMPPLEDRDLYPQFTREQISLLRAWIDQGAKWEE
jgi:mono/diheme cytochrome c family protein